MMGPKSSNAVKLTNQVIEAMKEAGMLVTVANEHDIDVDSPQEHEVDLDVIHDEVIFNVRIQTIVFAGKVEPIEDGQ